MKIHFGIDLGGTKIELVAIDDKFNILHRERISTESEKGSDHVLDQIDFLYNLHPATLVQNFQLLLRLENNQSLQRFYFHTLFNRAIVYANECHNS